MPGAGGSHAPDGSEAGAGEGAVSATAPVGDRRIPFTPENQKQFASFFGEHDQQAIDLAKLELAAGADAATKALAQRIIDGLTPDVRVLDQAAADLQGPDLPPMPEDPHLSADLKHMASVSGTELDRLFLLEMIAHLGAAIAPNHRAAARLTRVDLTRVSANLFNSQASEIGTLQGMLAAMHVTDAGQDFATVNSNRSDFGLIGDRRIPLTPANDAEFVDFFASQHEVGIAMALEEVLHGANSEVKSMAQSMSDVQTEELTIMNTARVMIADAPVATKAPDDPHWSAVMMAMKQTSGAALDVIFLEEMIPHHAASLPVAHRAKPHLTLPQLQTLADRIYSEQASEVGQLYAMLKTLQAQ